MPFAYDDGTCTEAAELAEEFTNFREIPEDLVMPIGKAPRLEDLPALRSKLVEIRNASCQPLILDADSESIVDERPSRQGEAMTAPTELFIVICRDRHTDPQISVHGSRAGADAKIEDFKAQYGNYYSWTEEDFGKDIGWLRCVVTEDEGPSARIESGKLEP